MLNFLKILRVPLFKRYLTVQVDLNQAEDIVSKIVYNSVLEGPNAYLSFVARKIQEKRACKEQYASSKLVSIKDEVTPLVLQIEKAKDDLSKIVPFPNIEASPKYRLPFTLANADVKKVDLPSRLPHKSDKSDSDCIEEEIRNRNERLSIKDWMHSYENFEEHVDDQDISRMHPVMEKLDNECEVSYGTPNPNIPVSDVPCGGCGAFLHCQDISLPGYIPSEIFNTHNKPGVGSNLGAIICQRCYFLKHFNIALQTRVSNDDYPKILQSIESKRGIVVLLVDLIDMPCSIWPGIADIFSGMPVVVVGNKVDLLPKDGRKYLKRIEKRLLDLVRLSGFAGLRLPHVVLVSAKTGYGIEELITVIQSMNRVKGDVYVVGCTNTGKSSLFNALLQSDLCKSAAMDLVQRATTSVWPGTTLNLLKFPIARPVGHKQFLRQQRLRNDNKHMVELEELREKRVKYTGNKDEQFSCQNATLIGIVGVSQKHAEPYVNPRKAKNLSTEIDEFKMPSPFIENFDVEVSAKQGGKWSGKTILGINENDPIYAGSKWCYDTPGVISPDQILSLLTTDELMLTLPKQLIRPRTYRIPQGHTLFIAGLARLDNVHSTCEHRQHVLMTVFASSELPITVCRTNDANEVYEACLNRPDLNHIIKVPQYGSSKDTTTISDRIQAWPGLEMALEFSVTGSGTLTSSKDVVLSNSGWIALAGNYEIEYLLRAWTPQKRGTFVRDCLLPRIVRSRGSKIQHTVAYSRHNFM